MDVLEIKDKVPYPIIESLLERSIKTFTPPQEQAIKSGLLEFANIVVASPTASGKTLIAEIACVNNILSRRKKSVYIAPMRALAMEKYLEFKKAYPYIKSAISLGDLDSSDLWLADYDMIFASTEKFDSLIRHGTEWLPTVGCIVFDEVHMIGDESRGPTLEVLMTKVAYYLNAQIIALSATIGNAEEISKWINANLVKSDYRPVKLLKGIIYNNKVYVKKSKGFDKISLDSNSSAYEFAITEDTLKKNKQIIIFFGSKRNAESMAKKLAPFVETFLTNEDKSELQALSKKITGVLEKPTEQCIKLGELVKQGVAFHHAGLLNEQRSYIEEAFKENKLKVVCATTTLALGVNMPAHTVLVRDLNRYDNGFNTMLGSNEVMQIFGRAGRPKYDTEGRGLIAANSITRMKQLYKKYIEAEPEPVYSQLGIVPVLRSHVLSFIAENMFDSKEGIYSFMSRTFYGSQLGSERKIKELIDDTLLDLQDWGFIEEKAPSKYSVTRIGKRVNELYIDPMSGIWLIRSLERDLDEQGMLYTISNTTEMMPGLRATEEALAKFAIYMHKDWFMPNNFLDNDEAAFTTALMLSEWINEESDDAILARYSITPGIFYAKLKNADWISYSCTELAKVLHKHSGKFLNLRIRLHYGIKEELLDLVRLQQVGRIRARILYNHGIKSVADVKANRAKVEELLGADIAKRIFAQFDEI
ncbi:MAG: DEAD/DEAH box helicase [Candidatus Micrarchaeia archaeon]